MDKQNTDLAKQGAGKPSGLLKPSHLKNAGGVKLGLRARLLLLTTGFVLFAELLIFPPSAASQRNRWLDERVQAAEIAAIALDASPDRELSAELSGRLMRETGMLALAVGREDMRELIFAPDKAMKMPMLTIDRRHTHVWQEMWQTFGHMFAPEGRYLRILDRPGMSDAPPGDSDSDMISYVEAIMPEAPLKHMLWSYSRNIFLLSLLISALTGSLVYMAVYRLMVKPTLRMTRAVSQFSQAPDKMVPFEPSGRGDEIGLAECALQDMQETVSASFRQKTRLAALGEAVAKINHDLRNSLAVPQLVSETINRSADPNVSKSAPRLERALTRAIDLAESTLRYGRIEARPPRMEMVLLRDLAEEAVREGLAIAPEVDWLNEIDEALLVQADPEHLHRIIANLSRNAAQAVSDHGMEDGEGLITLNAATRDDIVAVVITDNGPGVPDHVRDHMFEPFSEGNSRDGTGLGLAIARELAAAMGGDIVLLPGEGTGAVFEIQLRS